MRYVGVLTIPGLQLLWRVLLRMICALKMISGIKLRYLCRNKHPRIMFILMHGDDYVINVSSIRPGVRR